MKKSKQLSLLSIGTAALTLGSLIPVQAQTIKAQTLQNLNLRTGPSTSHSIILTIKKGSTIEVVQNQGEWSKVKYNGYIGYASSRYIKQLPTNDTPTDNETNTSTIMECNADALNVRSGPSTYDPIIGKLHKGDKVKVVYSTSIGWSKIEFKSGHGYVSSKYLTKLNQETTPKPDPSPENTTIMKCNASSLNVRSGPSTADNLIGTIKKGDKVEVIEQLSNGWSKIKYEGKTAYVSSQYLSKEVSANPPSSTTKFMQCSANILNVRSGPSTSSSVVGKLKIGDKVEVIQHFTNGWTQIKFNNATAYVSTVYLSN